MIPHGRPTFDTRGVAERAGVSPMTWRRRHHQAFTAVVHSLPGSARPIVYDVAQVDAWLAGKPLPPLPTDPHPDDLLTDAEAGAVAGLSASTIRADAVTGLMPPGEERHGRRWWTRAAATARADRAPQYKGRRRGAKDKGPRDRDPDHRVPEVAAELGRAAAGHRARVTTAELAERYAVSIRTAERLIAEARSTTTT